MHSVNMHSSVKNPILVETAEQLKEMPEEYQALVKRQLMAHAEGELSGADDYVKLFYFLTDDPYEKKVCCELAIDELDHYKRAADLLEDIGVDTSFMLSQGLEDRAFYATEALKSCENWAERALISYLLEDAVIDVLEEMAQSSYKPIADMCPQVLKDEKLHVGHGFRITREMARTAEGVEKLNAALVRMWPVTLDTFGSSDSPRSEQFVRWGLRQRTYEEARQRFAARARVKVEALGLTVPDDRDNRKFL
jgi:ring-1,2-phenylacetyl-CoA epoxidase subunit PaaA